jgi:quinoprotein glucose dehydrogenase
MNKRSKAAAPPYLGRINAGILFAAGLAAAVPGAYLLSLGGSCYYLVAGFAAILSAGLLWRGDNRGLGVYAALLVVTFAWSLWEVGFNTWALLPRMAGPLLFAVWLAIPPVRRQLRRAAPAGRWLTVCLVGITSLLVMTAMWAAIPRWRSPVASLMPVNDATVTDGEWLEYGRDKAGTRYSPLAQITTGNVTKLQPAWSFRTGSKADYATTMETTPLKVGDRLYFCTGTSEIIALDAETGKVAWRFDPHAHAAGVLFGSCRGVTYYEVPGGAEPCPRRLISPVIDGRVVSLDVRDGTLCTDFGDGGQLVLTTGMGLVDPGYYLVTSAPQIIRGKLVLGGYVTDGQSVDEPSGVVRAFDAKSGKFAWAWDMGRPAWRGLPQSEGSYTRGTPNSWAPISADESLGLVYLPTGNATPDYYGGRRRPFDDEFSSAIVALDAETGEVRWSFQTVHHDLWDYDVASQPTLVDLPGGIPALIQATKRGEVFLLDRRTGKPIAAVEERPAPGNGVKGEKLAQTQPFSTGMPSFAGPGPTEATMWGLTPFDQLWCRIKYGQARYDGTLTPLSDEMPAIVYPGNLGGIDWGGVSVDLQRDIVIVNSSRLPLYAQLLTRARADAIGLRPVTADYHGLAGAAAQAGTPYAVTMNAGFLSPLGVPCTQPPYGVISAFSLHTRKVIWSKPFGTAADSGPFGIRSHLPFTMGVPNIGGSVATRGGLFFIGATQDNYLRAYETATGEELWRARLPAGGQATPMTYWSEKSRRQFVVIAAGGHPGLRTTPGDYVLAFALPSAEIAQSRVRSAAELKR